MLKLRGQSSLPMVCLCDYYHVGVEVVGHWGGKVESDWGADYDNMDCTTSNRSHHTHTHDYDNMDIDKREKKQATIFQKLKEALQWSLGYYLGGNLLLRVRGT